MDLYHYFQTPNKRIHKNTHSYKNQICLPFSQIQLLSCGASTPASSEGAPTCTCSPFITVSVTISVPSGLVVFVYVTSWVWIVTGSRFWGSTLKAATAARNQRTVDAIEHLPPVAMIQVSSKVRDRDCSKDWAKMLLLQASLSKNRNVNPWNWLNTNQNWIQSLAIMYRIHINIDNR